jgi:hypothetical protein
LRQSEREQTDRLAQWVFSVHLVATIATLLVAASRFDPAGEFVYVAFRAMIPSPPHATKGDHAMIL